MNVACMLQDKLRHFGSILAVLDTQSKSILQETQTDVAGDLTKKEQ